MLERIQLNIGQHPDALTADQGKCNSVNLETCEAQQLNRYIITSRHQHGQRSRTLRDRVPRELDIRG